MTWATLPPLTVPLTAWRDEPPNRPGRWWVKAPNGYLCSWYITQEMLSPGQIFSRLSPREPWSGWTFAFEGE